MVGGENAATFASESNCVAPPVRIDVTVCALAGEQQNVVKTQQRPADGAAGAADQLILGMDGPPSLDARVPGPLKKTDAPGLGKPRHIDGIVSELRIRDTDLAQ